MTPKTRTQAAWETGKFLLRMALLIGVPVAVGYAANLTGFWGALTKAVLPVVLPLVDKFVHEDPRVPAKGLLPF